MMQRVRSFMTNIAGVILLKDKAERLIQQGFCTFFSKIFLKKSE
jgi:hypothetical protein